MLNLVSNNLFHHFSATGGGSFLTPLDAENLIHSCKKCLSYVDMMRTQSRISLYSNISKEMPSLYHIRDRVYRELAYDKLTEKIVSIGEQMLLHLKNPKWLKGYDEEYIKLIITQLLTEEKGALSLQFLGLTNLRFYIINFNKIYQNLDVKNKKQIIKATIEILKDPTFFLPRDPGDAEYITVGRSFFYLVSIFLELENEFVEEDVNYFVESCDTFDSNLISPSIRTEVLLKVVEYLLIHKNIEWAESIANSIKDEKFRNRSLQYIDLAKQGYQKGYESSKIKEWLYKCQASKVSATSRNLILTRELLGIEIPFEIS